MNPLAMGLACCMAVVAVATRWLAASPPPWRVRRVDALEQRHESRARDVLAREVKRLAGVVASGCRDESLKLQNEIVLVMVMASPSQSVQ